MKLRMGLDKFQMGLFLSVLFSSGTYNIWYRYA